jgi:hypothetical protein
LRDVSRDMRYTVQNSILNEHFYTDILEPEQPETQEVLVRIESKSTINRPAASDKSCHNSVGQIKVCAGSRDENDNEDESENEDGPPVVIDKFKNSSFTHQMAGLKGILGIAYRERTGAHQRRSQPDHGHRRSGQLEIEGAEAESRVQEDIVLHIRCDFGDGILSFITV